MELTMKKLLFIGLLLFCVTVQGQNKIELDSLVSKAFRFEFMECDLIKKELNSTEKLLLKEEKTASALEMIVNIQEREALGLLEALSKERQLKDKAYDQVDNLKLIIKKKDNRNTWEKIGIGTLCTLAGYAIGSLTSK